MSTGVALRFRPADAFDADAVALLHADSWRRHYRGAYADSFLDGDLAADRREVWSARLAAPADRTDHTATILAEHDNELVGFVHVVFDDDPRWGSLVDNLHVRSDRRRSGIGRQLLTRTARAVAEGATHPAMYLWVLQQNTAAQRFYLACGASSADLELVPPPGGDPARLNGTPYGLRMTWPDAAPLSTS